MSFWLDMTLIAALVTVASSAIISAVAYFYKLDREKKRNANRVLYVLLEIRYNFQLSVLDTEIEAQAYIERSKRYLVSKGIPEAELEALSLLKLQVKNHFDNVIEASKNDIQTRLLGLYEQAMNDLSSDQPLAAYVLAGKDKYEHIAQISFAHTEKFEDEFSAKDEAQQGMIEEISSYAKNRTKTTLSDHFDKDILELAKYCGKKTLKHTKDILDNPIGLEPFFAQLDQHFDDVFQIIIRSAQTKSL